jgi:hypothetical protein
MLVRLRSFEAHLTLLAGGDCFGAHFIVRQLVFALHRLLTTVAADCNLRAVLVMISLIFPEEDVFALATSHTLLEADFLVDGLSFPQKHRLAKAAGNGDFWAHEPVFRLRLAG